MILIPSGQVSGLQLPETAVRYASAISFSYAFASALLYTVPPNLGRSCPRGIPRQINVNFTLVLITSPCYNVRVRGVHHLRTTARPSSFPGEGLLDFIAVIHGTPSGTLQLEPVPRTDKQLMKLFHVFAPFPHSLFNSSTA